MKKTITTILFLLTVAFTAKTFGQTSADQKEEKPYIEVTGTAEKEVVPDEIYINIVIRERYSGRDKITIDTQEENLKTALKTIGIDIANLSLSDANADYVKVKWQKKDVLTKKDFTLKVTNATTVRQVFLQLDKLEITDAYISKVNHSKIDSLKKEVRIIAIKAAKEKADYLLAAISEQTGKPLVVQEKDNSIIQTQGLNIRGGRSQGTEYFVDGVKVKDEEEVQFQKIKIQSAMYVKFQIK